LEGFNNISKKNQFKNWRKKIKSFSLIFLFGKVFNESTFQAQLKKNIIDYVTLKIKFFYVVISKHLVLGKFTLTKYGLNKKASLFSSLT